MPITEEQAEMLKKVVMDQRHFIYKDVLKCLSDFDSRWVIYHLKTMWWFERFDRCPYCHEEIVITRRNSKQIYCCNKHRRAYANEEKRPYKTFVCQYCGEEFLEYTFRKAKYCSNHCAALAREAAKRAKKAEQK